MTKVVLLPLTERERNEYESIQGNGFLGTLVKRRQWCARLKMTEATTKVKQIMERIWSASDSK
jgi:hypothetical protein